MKRFILNQFMLIGIVLLIGTGCLRNKKGNSATDTVTLSVLQLNLLVECTKVEEAPDADERE